MDAIATAKPEDFLRAKVEGDPVNVHVVEFVPEPRPDFSEMQRTIEAGSKESIARREFEK